MNTTTAPAATVTHGSVSRPVAVLVRAALVASSLGLISTGLILVSDPSDQIGAWLQLGIGVGLAVTAIRQAWWAGGLIAAVATAAGLMVGHLSDYAGAGSSDIGPGAIAFTIVLLALTSTATAVLLRHQR
jgi:hypothetical protein